jgi:uncharacterized membrane protein
MSDEKLLDIVLEPNPPLPSRGVYFVLGVVALLSFIAGMVFVLRGAWPVTPFLGADVLLVAFAFRSVARRARRREILSLTRESLTLQRISPNGRIWREEINPYWLRVEHDDPEGIGTPLALVMRGRRWVTCGNTLRVARSMISAERPSRGSRSSGGRRRGDWRMAIVLSRRARERAGRHNRAWRFPARRAGRWPKAHRQSRSSRRARHS